MKEKYKNNKDSIKDNINLVKVATYFCKMIQNSYAKPDHSAIISDQGVNNRLVLFSLINFV